MEDGRLTDEVQGIRIREGNSCRRPWRHNGGMRRRIQTMKASYHRRQETEKWRQLGRVQGKGGGR